MKKRIISFVLVAVMTATMAGTVACAKAQPPIEEETTKTEELTTEQETTEKETETETETVAIAAKDTDITITGAIGTATEVVAKEVEKEINDSIKTLTDEQFADKTIQFAAYDITLSDGKTTVLPDGTVNVTIAVPKELQPEKDADAKYYVYWYNEEDDKLVDMKAVYDKKTQNISFNTNHFSVYVIVTPSKEEETTTIAETETADVATTTLTPTVEQVIATPEQETFIEGGKGRYFFDIPDTANGWDYEFEYHHGSDYLVFDESTKTYTNPALGYTDLVPYCTSDGSYRMTKKGMSPSEFSILINATPYETPKADLSNVYLVDRYIQQPYTCYDCIVLQDEMLAGISYDPYYNTSAIINGVRYRRDGFDFGGGTFLDRAENGDMVMREGATPCYTFDEAFTRTDGTIAPYVLNFDPNDGQ